MRCPKCQYISFDNSDRCRNCGYQFSLSAEAPADPIDLPIQTGTEPEGPFADFTLGERLPLFGDREAHDDRPLVSASAVPRAPLAVRKAAPAVAKPAAAPPRSATRRSLPRPEPELDLGPPEDPVRTPTRFRSVAVDGDLKPTASPAVAAPAALRLIAALIDVAVIGSIDAAVLHFTLKISGLEYGEIRILPIAPFAAFLLLLNGGYSVAFTAAGGQSIGKMITGVKVVPAGDDGPSDRVPLGQAVLRSAGYLVSALPAGLGFLPALIGADKRAVHDRLAHTRVVKA
jgi:uncharacterized RDD family membrane protein YckC